MFLQDKIPAESLTSCARAGAKNVINILFKNVMDGAVAAICFWLLGFGFAYGETAGGFIGTTGFGINGIYNGAGEGGSDGWEGFFFQWAFAGECYRLYCVRTADVLTLVTIRNCDNHCVGRCRGKDEA